MRGEGSDIMVLKGLGLNAVQEVMMEDESTSVSTSSLLNPGP